MAVFGFYNGHVGANTAPARRPRIVGRGAGGARRWSKGAEGHGLALALRALTTKGRQAPPPATLPSRARRIPRGAPEALFAALHLLADHRARLRAPPGLPHILVRFYTNPDGVAAKRTTMWVMILIGIFYVFPPVFGVDRTQPHAGTLHRPRGNQGHRPGRAQTAHPAQQRNSGALGSILSGITCAGAFRLS